MKDQNPAYGFFEEADFKPFSERELEMIIGGGSEEPAITFFDKYQSENRDQEISS